MPWTVSDVDKHKKGLTPSQKKKWVKIANGILASCQSQGGKNCEAKAIKIANSKFSEDVMEFDWKEHDEIFELKKAKAGGSNAGKYKTKGPFCGPAGGAPKGSYPVNTKKRAIAAIAYARHAPNPAGIKKCVCSHYPKLDACRKKGKSKMNKIPNGALRFVAEDCHAFAVGDDPEQKKLEMTIYSGKIIKNHFWWGNLAIDLDGLSFEQKKYPVLENHDQSKKIAFTGKPIIDGRLLINPETTKFVDTPASKEFQKLSSEGFPYQASMYALPTSVERVAEGEKADVNGFTLKGPATIWRKASFQEASVCVFGWDKQTQSKAFSRKEETEVEFEEIGGGAETDYDEEFFDALNEENNKEVNDMPKTVEELQEKYPELVKKLTAKLTADFDTEKDALNKKIEDLTSENEKKEDRLADLEKKDMIRTERELKAMADNMVNAKLTASDIPERLYGKIRGLLNHNKFMKDDVLDKEAFAEAIDKEIKDFEEIGVTNTVIGMGSTSRSDEDPEKLAEKKLEEEDDAAVDHLLSLAGEKVEPKDKA